MSSPGILEEIGSVRASGEVAVLLCEPLDFSRGKRVTKILFKGKAIPLATQSLLVPPMISQAQ